MVHFLAIAIGATIVFLFLSAAVLIGEHGLEIVLSGLLLILSLLVASYAIGRIILIGSRWDR